LGEFRIPKRGAFVPEKLFQVIRNPFGQDGTGQGLHLLLTNYQHHNAPVGRLNCQMAA
jgi:hypothetical protein